MSLLLWSLWSVDSESNYTVFQDWQVQKSAMNVCRHTKCKNLCDVNIVAFVSYKVFFFILVMFVEVLISNTLWIIPIQLQLNLLRNVCVSGFVCVCMYVYESVWDFQVFRCTSIIVCHTFPIQTRETALSRVQTSATCLKCPIKRSYSNAIDLCLLNETFVVISRLLNRYTLLLNYLCAKSAKTDPGSGSVSNMAITQILMNSFYEMLCLSRS